MISDQLREIASWRLAAELLRRYPGTLRLIETHPGGGQYDCLTLLRQGRAPAHGRIDLNRVGSGHTVAFDNSQGQESWATIWEEFAAMEDPRKAVDRLAAMAGLPLVAKLPPSTGAVLVVRWIAAFLAHAAFGRTRWSAASGFYDTSGHGGGKQHEWFARFPGAAERVLIHADDDLLAIPAYRFWFVLRDSEPQLCFESTGCVWSLNGAQHDLTSKYRQKRAIWPLIHAFAGDLLP